MRPAAITGVALALVGGVVSGPAHSAPTCPMVTDPAGDASYSGNVPGAGPGRSFDLRSVDIGARRDTLVASVHVDDLRLDDPHTTAGLRLNVFFRVGRHQFMMRAQNNTAGQAFSLWAAPAPQDSAATPSARPSLIGAADGYFDEQRDEIRIVAPIRKFDGYERLRPGSRVTHPYAQMLYGLGFRVDTEQQYNPYGDGALSTDQASGDAEYRIGSRSCIVG